MLYSKEECNLISNDQNILGKYFRFDVSLLQIIAVCDDIYILVFVVIVVAAAVVVFGVVSGEGRVKRRHLYPSATPNLWIRIRHGDANKL